MTEVEAPEVRRVDGQLQGEAGDGRHAKVEVQELGEEE